MAYSPTQWKAIQRFQKLHNAKPQLSAYPNVRFLMSDGSIQEHNIGSLVDQYVGNKKKEASENAKERRLNAKRQKESR